MKSFISVSQIITPWVLAVCLIRTPMPATAAAQHSTELSTATLQIISGTNATDEELYAAQELQRYLLHATGEWCPIRNDAAPLDRSSIILGQPTTNRRIQELTTGALSVESSPLGPQSYRLKSIALNQAAKSLQPKLLVIEGGDSIGTLYGTYALLEKCFGVRFYLTGDVFPSEKLPSDLPSGLDETVTPRQKIRGFLPWTNFPQSATSYSWEDYRFILDQMAKMRMNFLHIHNYNGEGSHNEMFHNFTWNGHLSRVWFPTARTGHAWAGPGWDVNHYLFGARDLFDDYDFGSDAALHNEGLSNVEVFGKSVTLFQRVLRHAHQRGVKIGLGIDVDLLPSDYGTSGDNPEVLQARASQIAGDYPDLDYFLAFRSERYQAGEKSEYWDRLFLGLYERLKKAAPHIQIAVSGWGLPPEEVKAFPSDVIAAPIAPYSAGWQDGSLYGNHEYWACPWLERDFNSSVYYYPYDVNISETVKTYQNASTNTLGLLCLTWRIGDAVEAKMKYIADAPWSTSGSITSSRQVYEDYARVNYGDAATSSITAIINENEAVAIFASECEGTPSFNLKPRTADIATAVDQQSTITRCIQETTSPAGKFRLNLLKERLAAVEAWDRLDENFFNLTWDQLPGDFPAWAGSFISRTSDISSLGNVMSTQNRAVQIRYAARVLQLRESLPVQPPSEVECRGNPDGAVITWNNEESSATGFNIYRDDKRITDRPLASNDRKYVDAANGGFRYSITALSQSGQESSHSITVKCDAGTGDKSAPQIFVISPPGSLQHGEPFDLTARILDGRAYELVSSTLHYKPLGRDGSNSKWTDVAMSRRTKAIFGARLGSDLLGRGIQYYVTASDGSNKGAWPAGAPGKTRSVIVKPGQTHEVPALSHLTAEQNTMRWQIGEPAPFWSRIYRSRSIECPVSRENLLTYVSGQTTAFSDQADDYDGTPLSGTYYYRVAAVDINGCESAPTESVALSYHTSTWDPMTLTKATDCTRSAVADKVPCRDGWFARHMNHLSWLEWGPAEFTTAPATLMVRLSSETPKPVILEARLDNAYIGPIIATGEISNTGGAQTWKTFFLPVTAKFSGKHTLYLRFNSGWGDHANIHYIKFRNGGTPFEAEEAEVEGGKVYDDTAASAGKGIGYFGQAAGNKITFNVPDTKKVIITYANENSTATQCTLYAGTQRVGAISFPPTGSWHNYQQIRLENLLMRGPLKLQFDESDVKTNDLGNKCAVNIDAVIVD
ncbi:MAG: carbohydrate-binding protein [Candidatus Sumerlaeaceae bacterium]